MSVETAVVAPVEPVPLPTPDLERYEPAVREKLNAVLAMARAVSSMEASGPDELAAVQGEVGMHFLAYDVRDVAVAAFANASLHAPRDHRWPYYLALIRARQARTDEAAQHFARVLELEPHHVPSLVRLGRLRLDQQDVEAARLLFERALSLSEDCAAARVGLAQVAIARAQHGRALEELERARVLAPAAGQIRYLMGLCYRELGEVERARALLSRAGATPAPIEDPLMEEISRLKTGVRADLIEGTRAGLTGDRPSAVAAFRRAVEADATDVFARILLAEALLRGGQLAEARSQLLEVMELDPPQASFRARAHFNLGLIQASEGRDEAAVSHYLEALRLVPDNRSAQQVLADSLLRLGRYQEASERYRRSVELDPGNPVARFRLSLALVRLGRYKAARDSLERAREALPRDAGIVYALAQLLAAAPDPEVRDGALAVELAERLHARESSPRHADLLAMALAEAGRLSEAAALQRRLVEASSGRARSEFRTRLELYEAGRPFRLEG